MQKHRPFSYVLICHTYPPVLGGSEVEAQRVSEELQKRGHKPLVVCAGGEPMPALRDWVDPCGVHVRLYGGGARTSRGRDVLYALGTAWTLFKERKQCDVAYFLMQGLHLATGLPVARMLGKPIVMKFSGSSLVVGMKQSWLGRLELRFLKWWAVKILILNPGMEEEALEVGFDRERLMWMPNPVDTEYFKPISQEQRREIRRQLDVGEEQPVAVFVGRLDYPKKLPWMLRAFAKVVKERPQALLTVVGDGPLREELHQLTADLGLQKNVRFTGRVSSGGVLQWLQAADTCILVSEVEGLPCSLIEAMSVGIPPVVSRIPAHTQLIDHEVNGLITEMGNEEEIAAAIIRVLDDRELRERMAVVCRRRMEEQFATALVVDRYEDLFTKCAQI